MWKPGMMCKILLIYEEGASFSAPMKLIELQRAGSNGWESWLCEDQKGKKTIRWVTPGSVSVDQVPSPALATGLPPRAAPAKAAEARRAGPQERLRNHKPILPDPAAVVQEQIQSLLFAMGELTKQVAGFAARTQSIEEMLFASANGFAEYDQNVE